MQKETFIIRTEWYEAISILDHADQAIIFKNLFAYHTNGEIVLDSIPVKLVWKLIEPTLERNINYYDRKKEVARENGKNGGRPAGLEKYFTKTGLEIKREDSELHYLYLVYFKNDDVYKIGETKNLFKRRLSFKVPTDYIEIIHYVEVEKEVALITEKNIIQKYINQRVKGEHFNLSESDIFDIINLYDTIKKPTKKPTQENESKKTLYDSDSVYDSVYDSESEEEKKSTPTQKNEISDYPSKRDYADQILPAPGDESQQYFYETEICMTYGFSIDEARDIHTAWIGDRIGQQFTLKEARQNFKGYASKWKMNERHRRAGSKNGVKTGVLESSYLT